MSILEQQTTNKRLREIIAQVRTDVEAGRPLSDAMGRHPRAFSSLYVNMVKAGETGGVLDEVLDRVAAYLEKEQALRSKIRSAMVYPTLLTVAALGGLFFMTIVILPQFESLFKELGAGGQLPLPTRVAMAVSAFIRGYWYIGLGIVIALFVVLRRYLQTPGGRARYDRFKLKMPVLGELNRKIVVARFTRTLGTLISSGVPIMQSLEVVSKAIDNTVIGNAIDAVRASIREGQTIAIPLQFSGVFPPMVVQMAKVGEETGQLEQMLEKVADFYDVEVEATVASLTSLLEPILIIFMGVVVGAMVISLYLPIFALATGGR
jgi:type IV pilus assembly protein PilC